MALASLLILLVDDDELSLEITGLQLAAIGHSVWKASSGAHALELLSQAMQAGKPLPDAILTDMQMPVMDGRSLCKNIRALGGAPLKVFVMSATELSDEQLGDFDGFVLKPLDLGSLRGILEARPEPRKFQPSPVVQMTEPALDAAILKKLRVLMPPDALKELLTAYLSDTRVRLTQMERFADTGDYQALRSCAHMIKGSASMTGASRVARIASQLETGELVPEIQKVLFSELRCACDAIEGTLAREDRLKEAHDHQTSRIG